MNIERELSFETDDGLAVWVRKEGPDDVPFLLEFFEHMGPESRYQRFNEVINNPDPAVVRREAQRLVQLSSERGGGWLAFSDLPDQKDAMIAGAHFVRTDPDAVELAVSVRDDLQRHGIATQFLALVVEQLRSEGLNTIKASFRADNRAVWAMLRSLPYRVSVTVSGSTADISVDIQSSEQFVGAGHDEG
ncbi:MAG: GNAT family N-acetyltransferase [Chloroflexota bacterium]|nr:GNAT family N-acetyltransferase [Chloroflexota bacterium]